MADFACALGAILLFALPGLALTRLFPVLRGLPLPRRAAYGYLLGLAAVAGGLYVLSFLGVPLRRPAIFTLAALPLPLFFLRVPRVERQRLRLLPLAAAIVAGTVSLGVLAEAAANPLEDWDGRMTWSNQARHVRAAGSVHPPALMEARWSISHPRYPLLMPVAQVAVLEAFGAEPDRQVFRALYAAFFPALLLVLYDGARLWAGRDAASLVVLAACATPQIPFGMDGGAAGAYSDLPLGCFYGAALVLLLRPAARLADGVAAGIFLAAAVLTKNEGALLAPAVVAVTALFLWISRKPRRAWMRLAPATLAAALALGFLSAWRAGIPNRQDEEYSQFLNLRSFWPGIFTRLPSLISAAVERMLVWELWKGFWVVAPLVLAVGLAGLRRRVSLPLALAAAAPLVVAWAAYSVHWDPVPLVQVTWDRMLIQASVPTFLLLSLALRDLLRRSGSYRQMRTLARLVLD